MTAPHSATPIYRRHVGSMLEEALTDTPVVLLTGARQTGKSTMVQRLVPGANYYTFDDAGTLLFAQSDPRGFLQTIGKPAVLDEVQLLPELFRIIKLEVDRDRRPGQYILTGSANVLLLPRLSDTLAGRMEVLTLWPLSQGELSGMREGFIASAFGDPPPVLGPSRLTAPDLLRRIVEGGFPEVVGRANARRTNAWFRSYTTTVLQRQIRDLSDIEALGEMPRVLSTIAAQATGLANVASLARDLDVAPTSMKRYLNLMRASYIVQALPGWSARLRARLLKREKLTVLDSGLLAFLQGTSAERLVLERTLLGPLLETFVMMELRKQLSWTDLVAQLYYLRTVNNDEVDLVIESGDGRVVGIEVKASATPEKRDLRGLEFMREELGERFIRGILLYTGEQTLPFGDRIWAMPVDGLWRWGATPVRD